MTSTWPVHWLLVVSNTNTEVVRTGSYLALAGVISLLICLLLLASVNMYITCRDPGRKEPPCLDITEFNRVPGLCSPYHTTYLHPARDNSATPGRKSSGSDGYAKPFHPGQGVSLSEHYVAVDMERDEDLPVLATGACRQGSTWYDRDNVLENPQNHCWSERGHYPINEMSETMIINAVTSAVLLVCLALIVGVLLQRFQRLLQATLRTELSRFLPQGSDHTNGQTTQSCLVKSVAAIRSHSLNRGMCTGCLTRGNYSRIDVDNLSDTSHDGDVTYNEYGCCSVTV